jgi:hypothetical protein
MDDWKQKLLNWSPVLVPTFGAIISGFFTVVSVIAIGAVMIYRFQLTEKSTFDLKVTIESQYKDLNEKVNAINLSLNTDKIDIVNLKDKVLELKKDFEKHEEQMMELKHKQ